MTFTVQSSPWVDLRTGDISYQLRSDFSVTNRAYIEVTNKCPAVYATTIANAIARGWIEAVAIVPKTDPTLMWESLKK